MFDFINNLLGRNQNSAPRVKSDDSSGTNSNSFGNSSFNNLPANRKSGRLTGKSSSQENIPVFDLNEFELETNNLSSASNNSNGNTSKPNSLKDRLSNTSHTTSINSANISSSKRLSATTKLNNTLENLNRESAIYSQQSNLFYIDSDVLGLISDKIASQYEILPISREQNNITFLFGSEMLQSKADTVLAHLSDYNIVWQDFEREPLKELIEFYYFKGLAYEEKATSIVSEKLSEINEEFLDKENITIAFDMSGELSGDNNKVRDVFGSIIVQAVKDGATDIHFSNNQVLLPNGTIRSELLVRARIEGLTRIIRKQEIPRTAYDAFSNIGKQLCGKDSTKHRDDGTGIIRATLKYGKKLVPVELRVQFMPSSDRGIGMCIRVQNKGSLNYNLSNNGMFPYQTALLQRHSVEGARGCTFISGGINTGKNCTLIALILTIQEFLSRIKREQHIVLVEKPSEFILDGISQVTLSDGKTYDEIIDALLRYDPDYIAIGEMRSRDKSAEMVIEIANVGHPVFATIHANSACEVPHRLVNLGVPRYKVVEALNVVTNQILVRKNCLYCTKELDVYPKIDEFKAHLKKLGIPTNTDFVRSTGRTEDGGICSECEGKGFKGRTGIFEVLVASEQMKGMIFREDFTSYKLLRQALKEGFQTLWHNGLRKAATGEIALSELLADIPRPTPESQGLDLNVNMDFTSSQEFALDLTN